MAPRASRPDRSEQLVQAAFGRIDALALAVAAGCLGAVVLAGSTAWLLFKGAPPGQPIGPHLGLLAHYLPGFSVTWPGAAVGAVHGALVGGALGWAVAAAWNSAHLVADRRWRRETAAAGRSGGST